MFEHNTQKKGVGPWIGAATNKEPVESDNLRKK